MSSDDPSANIARRLPAKAGGWATAASTPSPAMHTITTAGLAKRCLVAFLAVTLAASSAPPEPLLFSGLGPHQRKITTGSPEAQRWFNQALNWYFAFNFDEAQLAFRKAAELDPECAMAWWGASEAAGPQYNHPLLTPERIAAAREAMDNALHLLDRTTPVERALIEALQIRNQLETWDEAKQKKQNEEYAAALGKVWKTFPTDPDVGALYANARMTIRPWSLYETETRMPTGDTKEIQSTIERVLAIAPNHPGALHLYIHVIEPSTNPRVALDAADRLSTLVPASGHMLHMPTHIYIQTGHWDRAIVQNARAMGADAAYRARAPGRLPQIGYQIHNAHMLAFAAMMSARKNEAMDAARAMWAMWDELPDDMPEETSKALAGWIDTLMGAVYDVHKRFGDWDALLAEPLPPRHDHFPITKANRHAARAVAWANKKDFAAAEDELEMFNKLRSEISGDGLQFGKDVAERVLEVSLHFVRGEIELNRQNWKEAAAHLEAAVAIEDELSYTEPPQYLQPTRHALGAVYLAAGMGSKAARVYRRDLKEWPGNVWSLQGLVNALEAQNKDVTRLAQRLKRAKQYADFEVGSSCECLR